MACGGNNSGDLQAQQAQQQKALSGAINQINSAFSGFTPAFYGGVGQAYQNYQEPFLQQQYKNTADQLGFKLANQGLEGSSQSRNLNSQLANTLGQAQTQVGQGALAQEQQLQQQVQQSHSNLISQAEAASDPGQVAGQALATASSFGSPSQFQPIGNMFTQFAQNYLGSQNANTANQQTQFLNNYMMQNLLNPSYSAYN